MKENTIIFILSIDLIMYSPFTCAIYNLCVEVFLTVALLTKSEQLNVKRNIQVT